MVKGAGSASFLEEVQLRGWIEGSVLRQNLQCDVALNAAI
jgi:hypothetical protein